MVRRTICALSMTCFLLHSCSALAGDRKQRLSADKCRTGGLVGTFFGFGVGHAVIGEYGNMGWVFTVGELAGIGLMTGGYYLGISGDESFPKAGLGMILGGCLVTLGFRIWEIVDIWSYSANSSDGGDVWEDGDPWDELAPTNRLQTTGTSSSKFILAPIVLPQGMGIGFKLSY